MARTTARLERQTAGLGVFLRVRAGIGLVLLLGCACGVALAGAFLLAALGLLESPALTQWTSGFDAVLAVFMPGAFAWLTGSTGYSWWRHRHPGDPDVDGPGC